MDDASLETRQVLSRIHERQISEGVANRLPSFLDEVEVDITNAHCLDFGCGNTARDSIRMLDAGAKHVTLVDVEDGWMGTARTQLQQAGYHSSQFKLLDTRTWTKATTENSLDFIACNGVIHHLAEPDAAMSALSARLRPGGHLYLYLMGKGGVLRDFVMKILRDLYTTDPGFKRLIDSDPDVVRSALIGGARSILVTRSNSLPEQYKGLVPLLEDVIDVDFVLTLKDRVATPIYEQYDLPMAIELLERHGFTLVDRVFPAPRFKNIRALLEDVYAFPDDPISIFLMGSGNLHLLAQRVA